MIYVIIVSFMLLIILGIIFELNVKKIKEIGENKELDNLTKAFPDNIEICNKILDKLGNKNVKIKEDKESKTSLYVVINNTITIANIKDSFTRIQTIAHECIHSTQSKKMLWFNFIFTNIYLLYFLIIVILALLKVNVDETLLLAILILMGSVQYCIRSMLETDAMIKARFVAKEYLEEEQICSKEQINIIVNEYDKLNNIGIKLVNFDIIARNIVKVIIYSLLCLIMPII